MKTDFRDLTDPEEARSVFESIPVDLGTETISVEKSLGRVVADRIDAGIDVPGFDRSRMDGYAVQANDTKSASENDPVRLSVIGTVRAGEAPSVKVTQGTAVEISTGAVLPAGADGVVMVERTVRDGDEVEIKTSVEQWNNIGFAGEDVSAGERAIGPGTRISPRLNGLLGALGVTALRVVEQPRIGILPTGSELVAAGEQLDHNRGEIHDVIGPAMSAAIREASGNPRPYSMVPDDPNILEKTIRNAAADCDILLTAGSTSAGNADFIPDIVREYGDLHLHGIAIKPGKPTLVGTIDETPLIGLPGNPVSALTVFREFVAPMIRRAIGLPAREESTVDAILSQEVQYNGSRRRFVPVGLVETGSDRKRAYSVDRGSGAISSLAAADGFVTLPIDVNRLSAGERITVQRFSTEERPPRLLTVGEDDPIVTRLLDAVNGSRYRSVGTNGGIDLLAAGVPDVCTVAGPVADTDIDAGDNIGSGAGSPADSPSALDQFDATANFDSREKGEKWWREWGIIVPAGNPDDVTDIIDLIERDLSFVNRHPDSGIRASFDHRLEAIADDRGSTRQELAMAIDGYRVIPRGHESPARRVAEDRADAGLGLRATASSLSLTFIACGTEPVQLIVPADRSSKSGVREFKTAIDDELPELVMDLPGYRLQKSAIED